MHPDKVDRERVTRLTDLPNVGEATAGDLRLLGIRTPAQLVGQCPLAMYHRLCRKTGKRHDPCVLDVFASITGFMNGEPPQPWWAYTAARKRVLADASARCRNPMTLLQTSRPLPQHLQVGVGLSQVSGNQPQAAQRARIRLGCRGSIAMQLQVDTMALIQRITTCLLVFVRGATLKRIPAHSARERQGV